MGAASAIITVIATFFLPPFGVFVVAGCGADLLINILLTLLGYFPGLFHAVYFEYVYYEQKKKSRLPHFIPNPAQQEYPAEPVYPAPPLNPVRPQHGAASALSFLTAIGAAIQIGGGLVEPEE